MSRSFGPAVGIFLAIFLLAVPSRAHGDTATGAPSAVKKNIVQIASDSKDHSTLVTAVKAADLVNVLTSPGPYTVFAPTNAAFAKLPAGTVEGLLKPESKGALQNILEYHVFVGVLKPNMLTDGADFGEANDDHIKISVKGGKTMVNSAAILATIPADNGIVHVIDTVLLPPEKK